MSQIPDDVAVALAAVTQNDSNMQTDSAQTVVQQHATVLNNEIKQEMSIVPEVIHTQEFIVMLWDTEWL